MDWKIFNKNKRYEFEVEEKNRKSQFDVEYKIMNHYYRGYVKNIHKCLIEHPILSYKMDNLLLFNTKGLFKLQETGVSPYFLREYKATMCDELRRFFIKARAKFILHRRENWIF
jgi:hypothetical protein